MKSRMWDWGMAALLLLSVAVEANAGDPQKKIINCDIQNGPCIQTIVDRKVSLDITPRPVTAMEDLTFRVTIEGGVDFAQKAYIDLNMPAMNMGHNRVDLKPMEAGVYEGRGVIVRCKSGKRTWQAKITFPGMGSTTYIFDVIY